MWVGAEGGAPAAPSLTVDSAAYAVPLALVARWAGR